MGETIGILCIRYPYRGCRWRMIIRLEITELFLGFLLGQDGVKWLRLVRSGYVQEMNCDEEEGSRDCE